MGSKEVKSPKLLRKRIPASPIRGSRYIEVHHQRASGEDPVSQVAALVGTPEEILNGDQIDHITQIMFSPEI
jgi:hypothetical protein